MLRHDVPAGPPATVLPTRRTPLGIRADAIVIGDDARTVDTADRAEVLRAYVALVQQVRGGPLGDVVHLRRDDLQVLADHFRSPLVELVDAVSDVLHADQRERRGLTTLIAAGADVVGVRSSCGPRR